MARGPLTGRVRVRHDGDAADDVFYVGPTHASVDLGDGREAQVVSWAAPAAATFFGGPQRAGRQDDALVKVRRHFDTLPDDLDLTSWWDEWFVNPDGAAFEADAVGAATASGTAPTAIGDPAAPGTESIDAEQTGPTASGPQPADQPDRAAEPTGGSSREEVLRTRLLAPRAELKALLGTLQPEQYDLVAADPRASLVIQGYAGTGKTVVATHRAAWLTHSDRDGALGHVLLLGPTPTWTRHVAGVVDELARPETVTVRSLTEVMADLLDADAPASQGPDAIHATSEQLGRTLEAVVKVQLNADPQVTAFQVYDAFLKTNHVVGARSTRQGFLDWRAGLPRTFTEATADAALRPLLSYLVVLLSPPDRYDHVIVDEAQDLRPLELLLLGTLNAGAWTLVGDTSQRRTSHTPPKWKNVRALLGLEQQAEALLVGGYRSTQAIIDFSGALLPRTARRRAAAVIGQGVPVRVTDTGDGGDLPRLALDETTEVIDAHPGGTTAVITELTAEVGAAASGNGWNTAEGEGRGEVWRDSRGRRFYLLTSEQARGLEFDAVVVVEPAEFRERSGDYGPLYTALTRANLELRVVHQRSLPPPLVRYLRQHA